MKSIIIRTLKTVILSILLFGLILFLPAWTLNYWQAWVFIAVFTISANYIGIYLSLYDPELLERRKKGGPGAEKNISQKIISSLAILANISVLVFCALDFRFGWSPVPTFVSLIGNMIMILGFVIFFFVFRENSFGGSTIETVENQKVISTGLYGLMRHPMYVGAFIMVSGIPLALGSWWGLAVLAIAAPVLVWRILDEEKLLMKDLPGYKEYTGKVPYRLIPYLW